MRLDGVHGRMRFGLSNRLSDAVELKFGRAECSLFESASKREWLVTNGIGGYACGTMAGVLSRHYHGLLIAALNPPLGRTLTLVKLDETVVYQDRLYRLHANHWEEGAVTPRGFELLDAFWLEGTIPVWRYSIGDALLEKRIWMEQGANTTYVQYRLIRASEAVQLSLSAIGNYRDHHGGSGSQLDIETSQHGLKITASYENAVPYYVLTQTSAQVSIQHQWMRGFYKAIEDERGHDAVEDHVHVGDFDIVLQPNETLTFVITTEADADLDGNAAYDRRRQYEAGLIGRDSAADESTSVSVIEQLKLAADQFIVRRGEGHTVLAGYPWFSDWGRDTMIALPGLTIAADRPEIAASILHTFAQFVDQGMLPNRFPDEGETPEYNTVDATLWYFEAIRAYFEATQDQALIEELFPILVDIIDWHERGTRYGIYVDASDGLLHSGEEGVQLTWMDVKIDDWVVTPRTGKAVEINALWYNALCVMADFALVLGQNNETYSAKAEQVKASFQRFWNDGKLYDVLDTPDGSNDATLRPNQIFAVSLHHSPLDSDQQRAVVETCSRQFLTPHGLRSLSQDDPQYIGIYIGDRVQRDSAYHQGTVWSWPIGAFVEAHLRVYGDRAVARSFLEPMIAHLRDHAVGSVSEIFDGDAPFTPRGCFAQAWGVAELLRAWKLVQLS
jgi:predicted glycogen debranching enzyme